jgi:hypothetical protein
LPSSSSSARSPSSAPRRSHGRPAALIALIALPLAGIAIMPVRHGARGGALIAVLRIGGQLRLTFALLLAVGLALGH